MQTLYKHHLNNVLNSGNKIERKWSKVHWRKCKGIEEFIAIGAVLKVIL